MFNVGGGELLVIFLLALIVLGPDRLPGFARKAGRVLGEVRRISQGFQSEIRQAMDLDDADAKPKAMPPAVPRLVEPPAPAGAAPDGGTAEGSPATPAPAGPGDESTAPEAEGGPEPSSGTSAA
jgi:sec-independent protein translocase protein TatB